MGTSYQAITSTVNTHLISVIRRHSPQHDASVVCMLGPSRAHCGRGE